MKVVINTCYGGFGISTECAKRYFELKGLTVYEMPSSFCTQYLLVPLEEFEVQYELDKKNSYYEKSNAMCFSFYNIERDDPFLIQAVEELGEEASDRYSELRIVEIPDGIDYTIEDYDGKEWIAETHRTWS
jgi:hypothetical protein